MPRNLVHVGDIVQVELNGYMPATENAKGVVVQTLGFGSALIRLQGFYTITDPRGKDLDIIVTDTLFLPQRFLKVIDSPFDNRLGELEIELEKIREQWDWTKCVLEYSDDLREAQAKEIEYLKDYIERLENERKSND